MSDERLREAERKWRETGAVEDEARYLLERVRVGDLTQERLELAAYCGHVGALKSLEPHASAPRPSPSEWLAGLCRWDDSLLLEGYIAVADACSIAWTTTRPNSQYLTAMVVSARSWAQCPCDEHLNAVMEAGMAWQYAAAESATDQDAAAVDTVFTLVYAAQFGRQACLDGISLSVRAMDLPELTRVVEGFAGRLAAKALEGGGPLKTRLVDA